MQLYCKEKDKYLDLSSDSNFTFSLQNQWQHFWEEPEDFSYSTRVPNTQNNLELLVGCYDANGQYVKADNEFDVVIDNYTVLNRFKTKVISKDLATMEISLYRTRILPKMKVYRDYGVDWTTWSTKVGGKCNGTFYASEETAQKNQNKPNVTFWSHWNGGKDIWYWKQKGGEVLNGDGELKAINTPYLGDISFMRIGLKHLLEAILGYVPEDYANDETYVDIPFSFKWFKINGKIEVTTIYKQFNNQLLYTPKYGDYSNAVQKWGTQFKTNWYNASSPWGDNPWNALYYRYWKFPTTRDDIRYDNTKVKSQFILQNSNTPIFPFDDLELDERFHGVAGVSESDGFKFSTDVDVEVDMTDKTFLLTEITPSMIISMHYERLAKELPLLCDYEKGIDTIFHQSFITLKNKIIDWKETLAITEEDQTINNFKVDFDKWSPFWFGSLNNVGKMNALKCNDLQIQFMTSTDISATLVKKIPMLVTWSEQKKAYITCINRVEWNNWTKTYEPVGYNTSLYCENYKNNTMAKVECTCTDYDFSNTVLVDSRYFVVDKVETSDFKIFKLTLIEYPAQ